MHYFRDASQINPDEINGRVIFRPMAKRKLPAFIAGSRLVKVELVYAT